MQIKLNELRQIIREELSRINESSEHDHETIWDKADEMLKSELSPDEISQFMGLAALYDEGKTYTEIQGWLRFRPQIKRLLISAALGNKPKSVKKHLNRLSKYLDEYLKVSNQSIDDLQDDGWDSFVGISEEIMSNPMSASFLKRRWKS